MRDKKIFDILEKIATNVIPVKNTRFASCIVIKKEIISFGTNKKKSHPFQKKFSRHPCSIFLHAEINTIKNSFRYISLQKLSKSTLYVLRLKQNGERGLAKPCIGCLAAIREFGIRNVVYTTNNKTIQYMND